MTSNAVLLDKYQDYLAEKQFDILISLDGDEWGNSYRTDHAGNFKAEKEGQLLCNLNAFLGIYNLLKNIILNILTNI